MKKAATRLLPNNMANREQEQIHSMVKSLTVHGLSKVFSSQTKLSRLVWLVLFVLAFAMLINTVAQSFIKFGKFEVAEKVQKNHYKNLSLPAVTLCDTNVYNPLLYQYFDPPVFQNFPASCNFTSQKYFKNYINLKYFDIFCKMFFGNATEKTAAISMDVPRYIKFPDGFSFLPHMFPCVTLNRHSMLTQYTAGKRYGLNMIIYNAKVNDPLYTDPVKDPLRDRRRGIMVSMHDPKEHLTYDEGVVIPAGFHSHISLKKSIEKRLPSPYTSKCEQGGPDKKSIYPGKNTQLMCSESCKYMALQRHCKGLLPMLKPFIDASKFPYKGNSSFLTLAKCITANLATIDRSNCQCLPHCYDEMYTPTTSRTPWPEKWHVPYLTSLVNNVEGFKNRTLSLDELREKLLMVSIYYEEFTETLHEEEPRYDLLGVASDLGGQLGLFIGASLISIAEILSLAFFYIKRKVLGKNDIAAIERVT